MGFGLEAKGRCVEGQLAFVTSAGRRSGGGQGKRLEGNGEREEK